MYRRAVPVITSRIDMRSLGPEGLNRQSPSRVVGMATSVEPSGGLLKLDNQKLYVWLVVLSFNVIQLWERPRRGPLSTGLIKKSLPQTGNFKTKKKKKIICAL